MMRWIAGLLLVLCVGVIGCRQQIFLCEKDLSCHLPLVPPEVEKDKHFGEEPITGLVPAPPDVNAPERKPRYMTLQEAIAISLENGTSTTRTGSTGQGLVDDGLPSFQGGSITAQASSIRVLALTPAIAAANIEGSLARFDAQWITSMNWTQTDQLQQGLQSFQNGEGASFQSGIAKPNGLGGVFGTFFETDYRLLSNPPQGGFGVLNPSYTTRLRIGLEQPLLQGFGSNINQLLSRTNPVSGITFPGQAASSFNQRGLVQQQGTSFVNSGVGVSDGILITRVRFNSSRAEFERQVTTMVLDVEVAYWKLYQAYGDLYTFEEVLRIAHKSWMINYEKFKAGTIGPANFFPIRGQYEEFRGERLKALGRVLEAERNLRGLMGLPVEDSERIVPVTPPTLAPYRPDWDVCLQDALNLRPELVIARESLRAAQYNLDIQKNFLKPDLRFNAQYIPTGFGTRLDGRDTFLDGNGTPRPENALQSLRGGHFVDYNFGLTLNVPIGYRLEHASIRAGRLALAQSFFALKNQEDRVKLYLTLQYQKLAEWYGLIEMTRAERKAYAKSVEARFAEFVAGKTAISDFLLEAQRRLALAQQKEYQAIAEYNNTLSRLEWARGNLLRHNSVVIAEGALPHCAEVRAVDNERERTRALLIREKPEGLTHPGRLAGHTADLPENLDVPVKAIDEALPEPGPGIKDFGGAPAPDAERPPVEAGKTPLPFDRKLEDSKKIEEPVLPETPIFRSSTPKETPSLPEAGKKEGTPVELPKTPETITPPAPISEPKSGPLVLPKDPAIPLESPLPPIPESTADVLPGTIVLPPARPIAPLPWPR